MKRTTRGGSRRNRRKGTQTPARRKRAAAAAKGRPASRGARARKGVRKVAPRKPTRRVARRRGPKDGRLAAEENLQLADPVEAAQEDVRVLPEKPLFDRDGRDDDLAELLGEEYVRSVTSGEEQGVELRDEPTPEEEGGPFIESSAKKEFGYSPDEGEPEPMPLSRRPPTKTLR